jgi:MmyB-like transcription regulator ligand binding domain/Helix-turn-helix domain
MTGHSTPKNLLGTYLKDRRAKLDPAAFEFPPERRRIPGLRREEVVQRANISPTGYTWLEHGPGRRLRPTCSAGSRAPSLMLTDVKREHLFLIGLARPPEARYRPPDGFTPRLQRVLDALESSPALGRTETWSVVAWNRAASAMLIDYGSLPQEPQPCA